MELQNTPALNLESRLDNRAKLLVMKKEIEAQLDAENEGIKAELVALGVDSLNCGESTITLTVRDRKTLDKGALVALGVGTDVIEQATKVSTYLQMDVRARKVAA